MKLMIDTWGSCHRSYVEILHPKRLDLTVLTSRRGEHEVEITGICKIKYENRDSSKNLHRYVEVVDVYAPYIVVRNWGALSCSRSFDKTYKVFKDGDSVKFEELEQKEEVAVVEDGKFRIRVRKVYVEVGGQKIYVAEKELSREVCVDKLEVRIKTINGRVYVLGDTYHIKDKLKSLGYRWDPNVKAWYKSDNVNNVKEELEKKLGLQVATDQKQN